MELDAEEESTHVCQMCGGIIQTLGALGTRWHGRCRDCGMEYSWTEPKRKNKTYKRSRK